MSKTSQVAVAEKITKSSETTTNIVIDKLAEVEISRRVDILTNAIKKQEPLEKELKKIDGKEDVLTYVGGVEVKAMSKERFEEIKKAKEKIDKLNEAIENVLKHNTHEAYNKLDEIVKKLNNVGNTKE